MEDVQRERERLHRHWKQRLERSQYESERVERQYQAVEPENRLVARTLEKRWEEMLCQQRELEEEYHRFLQEQPQQLSDDERSRIKTLSSDLPALWDAPMTTAKDRKEIIRLLVERVIVHVRPDSEYVGAVIHWRGGQATSHEIVRPVVRYEQLRDYDQLMERIERWRREGHTAPQIAEKLNAEGFRTPKTRGDYTADLVQNILARRGLSCDKAHEGQVGSNEWWLPDLARELEISSNKLRSWVVRGWVEGRKTPWQGLWIVWADAQERKRLLRLRDHSKRGVTSFPASWTTPRRKGNKKR
jgi:hypothetical protein